MKIQILKKTYFHKAGDIISFEDFKQDYSPFTECYNDNELINFLIFKGYNHFKIIKDENN